MGKDAQREHIGRGQGVACPIGLPQQQLGRQIARRSMRAGAIRPLLGQKRKVQVDEGSPGDIPQKIGRQIKGIALEHDVGGLKVLMDKRSAKGVLCLGKRLKARGHE